MNRFSSPGKWDDTRDGGRGVDDPGGDVLAGVDAAGQVVLAWAALPVPLRFAASQG